MRRIALRGIRPTGLSAVARFDDSINAQSTLTLLRQLERRHAEAETFMLSATTLLITAQSHARDGHAWRAEDATLVSDYLKDSKIELVFLPPYSPNLNLIERYWKFFHKKVLYTRYYEKFEEFEEACVRFFRQPRRYLKELR